MRAPKSNLSLVSQFKAFGGVIGHFHIQTNKVDPGPAFDWDGVIGGARRELGLAPTK